MKIKKCLICGEAFAVGIYQARRLYCCDCAKVVKEIHQQEYRKSERRKKYNREYRRKKYAPTGHTYVCKKCGKPQIIYGRGKGNTRYCLDCVANLISEYSQKRNKEKYKPGKTESICWSCKNAVPGIGKGCSWSRTLSPVQGWEAEETIKKKLNTGMPYIAYKVKKCPMFQHG